MKINLMMTAAVAACAAMLAGCGRDAGTEQTSTAAREGAPQQDLAMIRVLHAIPEAPKADVYTGDQKAFSDVGFGTVTAYKSVPEETFTISLRAAGQVGGPTMVEAKEGVDSGKRYTILALPDRDGSARIDAVSDETDPPAPGKAKIRVIHAASQAGDAEIYAPPPSGSGEPERVETYGFNAPATYTEVEADRITVKVQSQGGKTGALMVQEAQIEPGKLYTIVVLSGSKAGKPIDLMKIEESLAGAAPQAVEQLEKDPSGKQKAIAKPDFDRDDYGIKPEPKK
jgi:hypothetical protein